MHLKNYQPYEHLIVTIGAGRRSWRYRVEVNAHGTLTEDWFDSVRLRLIGVSKRTS